MSQNQNMESQAVFQAEIQAEMLSIESGYRPAESTRRPDLRACAILLGRVQDGAQRVQVGRGHPGEHRRPLWRRQQSGGRGVVSRGPDGRQDLGREAEGLRNGVGLPGRCFDRCHDGQGGVTVKFVPNFPHFYKSLPRLLNLNDQSLTKTPSLAMFGYTHYDDYRPPITGHL